MPNKQKPRISEVKAALEVLDQYRATFPNIKEGEFRERYEVLIAALITKGFSEKEIAELCETSEQTIVMHYHQRIKKTVPKNERTLALGDSVSRLSLSRRAINAISYSGAQTIADLIEKTAMDLSLRNCGPRTLTEIIMELSKHGFTLAGQ